ncbi:MAG TPA: hypothetical protein VGK59_20240 [Ohtaekwangia sp.]
MVRVLLVFLLGFPLTGVSQLLDFGEVVKLSGTVNSTDEEVYPLVSSDGRTLFFSRLLSEHNKGGKFSGSDVWVSRYDVTTVDWGKSRNSMEAVNTTGHNVVVGCNPSGEMIYLMNTTANKRVNGLYFSKLVKGNWTSPEFVYIPGLDVQSFLGAYVTPEFDVILLSYKGDDSKGEEDLYISLKNGSGEWSKPKNLGPTINTRGFEISPYLSADKKRLYFASDGHPGFGKADIFYCDRLYDSWETWTAPKNLGEKVNTAAFDAYFSVHRDSIAYFSSDRMGKSMDIFSASMKKGGRQVVDSQVRKLIEESKSLLDQVREGTSDLDNMPQPEKIVFTGSTITSASVSVLNKVATQAKAENLNLIILSADRPELKNINLLRANRIKDELVRLKVDVSKVFVSDGIMENKGLQERIAGLAADELLIVFWR